ncbi:phosphatase PAP2 family protein [Bacillus sp. B-jedd]|uniref:phosphatase PAP2 family protein n=1 Tax=Bacillus sp. B-jedd TaxID=1476857 RepID=UPI00051556C1|nr:phosphatase PAP2 family protein [Bacillus sp. B-jedd]CEG29628.1 PA-phosphatase like phosphoesterase [Bacillus sp. B-jedd]
MHFAKRKAVLIGIAFSILIILMLLPGVLQDRHLLIDTAGKSLLAPVPDGLDPLFISITHLGDRKGVGITALIVLMWLLFKRRDFFAMGIFAMGVALGNELNKLLKELIGRERPDLEHLVHVKSLSFPSGHAMVSSILYILIAYFLTREYTGRKAKFWIYGLSGSMILLIGASRVILNVHYPSDVIGGYAFGFIWASCWIYLYSALRIKYSWLSPINKQT